ncbi:3-oxoacyl-ACP synthase III family protein [Lipingzhangella sp. LS1_29]|uniref:3-oxoacyl-ACP synthase III family protein n=1 Tax=Lipingzhangella rawalii TaxID=2055835 RepID=A0ABU2H6H8_9ACTN|nr:3-oxoacyl-ACP synthase III family protein [Lipingzhangella rawalii]MDS1270911.1 3-oxoacyl-ACP synthase III family protein [Lipingzhangella rawalii]
MTTAPGTTPVIAAVGTALPGPAVGNAQLENTIGASAQWIEMFIGTRTRHFAVDIETGEQHTTLTDLAERAAFAALSQARTDPRTIDFVVLATASPDELMPATVNQVADRLGLDQIPTYQLQSGCAGAVQALDLACMLLQRPGHRTGLVIGGDVCAKHLLLDRDFTRLPSHELVNYVLFGDGAGAVVVTDDERASGMCLRMVLNRFTGQGRAPGQIIRWFGAASGDGPAPAAEEDYKAIETRVPSLATETLWELADEVDWKADELDFVLPPQLSGRMTGLITEHLGVPHAREISCVADTGNNGNALPFFQLEQLANVIAPDERAVAITVESSKWLKGGFAVEAR